MSEILYIPKHSHLWFNASLKFEKSKQRSRVSNTSTMDITPRNLVQQEEILDKKWFRKSASDESIYWEKKQYFWGYLLSVQKEVNKWAKHPWYTCLWTSRSLPELMLVTISMKMLCILKLRKGKGIGLTQEVTRGSFIDYRLSIMDIDFPDALH